MIIEKCYLYHDRELLDISKLKKNIAEYSVMCIFLNLKDID